MSVAHVLQVLQVTGQLVATDEQYPDNAEHGAGVPPGLVYPV